ncbi:MAG: type II toxin-antitoxin system Phd/YefM family antitoxin [Coriobacteriia bacterium]|nr:type II toxin-antitoxin system Phd/YefM family antitoxin [Coriobacteriia bacterium]
MTNTSQVRHISASELAGNVSSVLDCLESGTTVIVTRRGEPVAVMQPATASRRQVATDADLRAAEEHRPYPAPTHTGRISTPPAPIARLIGTPSVRAVLSLFVRDPSTALHQREIARRAGVGLRSAQLALGRLEDIGLVASERSGNRRYYRAVRTERFEELRSLMARDLGVGEVIARHLGAAVRESIEWAFIFGSVASGQDKIDSDIDLFVVGEVKDDDLAEPIAEAQRELGREIDVVSYRPATFRARRDEGNHFIESVLAQPRLDVIGGFDDA